MIPFVASRMLQGLLALFALSLAVFGTTRASGDPLQLLLPPEATREDHARMERELGFDRPLPVQYGLFIAGLAKGDLGRSLRSGEPVTVLIAQRAPASLELAATAFLLIILAGIPLGVASALARGSGIVLGVNVLTLIGQSTPAFWLGILLIEVFAVTLRWLPSGTNLGAASVVLPAVSVAGFGLAAVARLLRSSMLEVLGSDFIALARAKGLSERLVIGKHAMRNALLPVVSLLGVLTVGLITSSITTETVFAWPGLGLLTYTSILNRDFPVVQGVTLFAGAVSILVGLAGEILAVMLDPRIRLRGN